MRIIVDGEVLQYSHTGVAKVTLGLYRAILKVDPSVEVAFICRGKKGEIPAGAVRVVVSDAVPRQLWRSVAVPLAVRGRGRDLVHFPWNGRVAPGLGVPVVTTVHDVLPLVIPGYFREEGEKREYTKGMRRDLGRSALVVTDSEYSKNEIVRHFQPALEPVVIYPATEIGNVGLTPGRTDEGYFVYVGGYARRKGIEALLAVFLEGHRLGRLKNRLLLTGEPLHVSDECTKMIAEGKQIGVVEERGYVDESLLAGLYRNATALLYPSLYEGFGLPPLEGMTLGCPVVTTRGTSLPEVCGDAAAYVDPSDPRGFLETLSRVEADTEFRQGMITRGYARAVRFSYERSAEVFLTMVRSHVR